METPKWMADAACQHHPIEIFVPEYNSKTAITQAKQICDTCPVKQQCLDYALDLQTHGDLQGIFGGTTTRERRRMLGTKPQPPQPRPQRHGTLYGYRKLKCRCTQCRAAHAQTITRQRQTRRNTTRRVSEPET